MEHVDRTTVTPALKEQYTAVTELVERLDENTFLRGTGCTGWCVRDLLFHLLLDAQRGLVALNTPASTEPDRDLVTYWQDWRRDDEKVDSAARAHAKFVRLCSAAYSGPTALGRQWRDTAMAAVRVAGECPQQPVATQGHVLTSTDLVGILAVEAAVHYLDLTKELPDTPAASQRALALVRHTLEGLSGAEKPTDWDDTTFALKGTGRLPLEQADRAALGKAADLFPLFG